MKRALYIIPDNLTSSYDELLMKDSLTKIHIFNLKFLMT